MKTIRLKIDGGVYILPNDETKYTPVTGEWIRLVDMTTKKTIDVVKAIPLSSCKSCCFNGVDGCMNSAFTCPMHLQFQSMIDTMEEI